jgi:curved DNA-binding protein CbpA
MSADLDYYRVLHVQPDAPAAIIEASYRALMQRLKTETSVGADRAERALNEAYAVLSDGVRRAAYDLQRDIDASSARAGVETASDAGDAHFGAHACLFCGSRHGLQRALERDDDCAACGSPLCPAERHRHDYSGQRMLGRIPKHLPLLLYTGWPQSQPFPAEMRNISLNGMKIAAPQRLPVNQIVKIDSEVCRALGRVAYCERDAERADGFAMGIEFLTLRFTKSAGTFVSARV